MQQDFDRIIFLLDKCLNDFKNDAFDEKELDLFIEYLESNKNFKNEAWFQERLKLAMAKLEVITRVLNNKRIEIQEEQLKIIDAHDKHLKYLRISQLVD